MKVSTDFKNQFQTPPDVCRYMASLVPNNVNLVLEPTPGIGNLKNALISKGFKVVAPDDYFLLDKSLRFDAVVMNPPFSAASAFLENAPIGTYNKGMKLGYRILFECMHKADIIIALMPWFTISDSDVRLRFLKNFGLVSITALPRKTFQYVRIQTCILFLKKGYTGNTEFIVFDQLTKIKSEIELLQKELF